MIYYNGKYIKDDTVVSVHDSGFTTGIGIFDSMLSYKGELIHCVDHYDRIIFDSKNVIGLPPKITFTQFVSICRKLLSENGLDKDYARIRTTVTGDIAQKPLSKTTKTSLLIHVSKTTTIYV